MQVGLYFGSFNPVHIGHCIIATHVLNHSSLDQVWFVVSPQNPFKSSSTLLNEYQRLHLVQLAVDGDNKLIASDIEFKLPRPSFTIDTLTYLQEKYPDKQFSVIIGSDSYENLHKWKNGDLILRNYQLYIYPRPGHPVIAPQPQNVAVVDAPLLEISSTRIRESIRSKKSIRYLVPEKVLEEIERAGFYK